MTRNRELPARGPECKKKNPQFPLSHSVCTSPFPFFGLNSWVVVFSRFILSSLSHLFLLSYSHHSSINMVCITQKQKFAALRFLSSSSYFPQQSSIYFCWRYSILWWGKFTQSFFFFMQHTVQILRTNLHPLFLSNEIKADSETVRRLEDSETYALGKGRFVLIKKSSTPYSQC